jgi:hypothetical protein
VAVGAGEGRLLGEVAAVHHAGELDAAAQLQLAPAAAGLRPAQRVDQRRGLAAQQLGAAPHAGHLLAQLGLGAGPLHLQPAQLDLDQVELLAQRPDQVLDGLPLADQLPAGLLAGAGQRPGGEPLEGGQQQLLVAAGQQPAEQQPGREPQHEPGQQAEQQGGSDGHAGTVAPASDRTGGHAAPVPSYGVSLSLGIVGLPNVGKSTLFNALTKNDVLAANYPFATIEPNVGVVGCRTPGCRSWPSCSGRPRPSRPPSTSWTSPASSRARARARASATSSWPTSGTATRSAR